MSLRLAENPVPLRQDEGGAYRIGDSRVRLETVLFLHKNGASPEQIVSELPSLQLGDVYAVVGYYLHHRSQVDAYLADRERQAEGLRAEVESQPRNRELRAKLQERRRPA